MTPTLHFVKGDTAESALQKATVWFDRICDDKVSAFATAVSKADVSCDEMIAVTGQAQLMAAEARAEFLARTAEALDAISAGRSSGAIPP